MEDAVAALPPDSRLFWYSFWYFLMSYKCNGLTKVYMTSILRFSSWGENGRDIKHSFPAEFRRQDGAHLSYLQLSGAATASQATNIKAYLSFASKQAVARKAFGMARSKYVELVA